MSQRAATPRDEAVETVDLSVDRDELLRRFRLGVRRAIATDLSAGRPVYYGGTGDDAGRLYVHLPDGRRFEYRVLDDGTREMIRELPR